MGIKLSDYYETNKKRWNELVGIHADSEEYDIEGFLAGKNSLHKAELDILGDVSGKSLLHLQCHFGVDTISWSRLGAKTTGIDFSDTAIELARELAKKAGTDTRFVCSNVYDLKNNLEGEFDIVFTSIGVLCWLQEDPDSTAKELFERIQRENPGHFPDGQLRTLQRRIYEWRQVMARKLVYACMGESFVQETEAVNG